MMYKRLSQLARNSEKKHLILSNDKSITYEGAKNRVDKISKKLAKIAKDRVCFYRMNTAWSALALIAAEKIGIEASVLSDEYDESQVFEAVDRIGGGIVFDDVDQFSEENGEEAAQSSRHGEGRLVVFTTGTTGTPKAVRYKWNDLISQAHVRSDEEQNRWLLFYPLSHFAGIQVFVHVLKNASTLVIPDSRGHEDVLQAIKDHRVTAASATPTFWRLFAGRINTEEAQNLPLRYITLGGEAATKEVLDQLQNLFPNASISHVYATTEVGSCFSVKDGKPGFPREFLDRTVGNVELKIEENELYVRSSNRMEEYVSHQHESDSDWFPTGDLVEVKGDRVFFRGRTSESINVGGVKVYPLKVEEAILSVPNVQAVRAYGESNPITGEVVAVDVEPSHTTDKAELKKKIDSTCEERLNEYERPRSIRVKEKLDRKNGKITRKKDDE